MKHIRSKQDLKHGIQTSWRWLMGAMEIHKREITDDPWWRDVGAVTFNNSRFCKNELIPRENEVVKKDKIPDDIVQQMRELGLFGLTIPEEYGGLGITMEEEVRVAFELGQTSPAFRSLIGTNNGIGSSAILIDGTEEQKQNIYLVTQVAKLLVHFV